MSVPKKKPNYNGDEQNQSDDTTQNPRRTVSLLPHDNGDEQNQSDDTTQNPREELSLPPNEYIKIKKEITSLLNQIEENIKGTFKSKIDKETTTIQEVIKQNTENIKIEMGRKITHINETIEQNIDNTKKDFKTRIGKVVGKLNFLIVCCCVISIVLSASVSITLSFKMLSDEKKKTEGGRDPVSIGKPTILPGNSTKEKKVECIDKIKLQEYVKDQPVCK